MAKSRKPLPPFWLDMDPDEALERFAGTDPQEVEQLIARSKGKKPKKPKQTPGSKKPSGVPVKSQSVVSLRDRRTAKRNNGR